MITETHIRNLQNPTKFVKIAKNSHVTNNHPNTPRPGELQRASLPQQRGFKMDNRQLIMNSALTLFYESAPSPRAVRTFLLTARNEHMPRK